MTTAEILARFGELRALVVGDICLDRWCAYDPAAAEPSAETGIPRIGVVATEVTPGAGGTVANNLAALGAGRVAVLGVAGTDGYSYELVRALEARGIRADLLVQHTAIQTFTYTKLINAQTGVEDQPRVDFISTQPLPAGAEERVLESLRHAADDYDVILVSDQAETAQGGVVTPAVRELMGELALRHDGKVFWVDSRKRIELFRHAIIKPNRDEAEAACARLFGRTDYQALRCHNEAPLVFITHGSEGVLVVDAGAERWVRTRRVENPVDICGAGDSFSAGAALALAVTRDPLEAARFGNVVASITIMKWGTGTASTAEVLEAGALVSQ